MPDTLSATVILDDALGEPLTYAIPDTFKEKIRPGMRVLVPVKNSLRKGTLYTLESTLPPFTLKPISELLSEKPLLPPELMELASWMSTYYAAPLRQLIQIFLPPSVRQGKKEKEQLYIKSLISQENVRTLCEALRLKSPKQAAVLDCLLTSPKGLFLSQLLEKGLSKSPITTLIKKNILSCQPVTVDRTPLLDYEFFPTSAKSLTTEQQHAFEKIENSLKAKRFEAHLLFGVTGSGKTEIYLRAIETALLQNQGVIFLVPEIALTSQTVERLKGRFKEKIVLLHHRLSEGERLDTWNHIAAGNAPLVIGARSALFSPLPNLGLIIVDEEHDNAYKQTDSHLCYHARDTAVMRAKLSSATILLGSATPSLASYTNALKGKYTLSTLKERPASAHLPHVTLIDMKREYEKTKGYTLFSDTLLKEIEIRMEKGEQTLLFLNRRGYHTSRQCLKCGHVAGCPNCDVTLTFHHQEKRLSCHLCDFQLSPPPSSCPKCQTSESLKYKGAGTELVESALHAIFPTLRTLRLDADTTRHKGSHEKLYKQFRSGKADLLIGTQMIAKGLHFPAVTLVGILNIDSTLHIPDFRASESAFQLITQVAGRAGRADLPGEVIIQTSLPDHPTILQAAEQNYLAFYQSEIETRRIFQYPPFLHLIKITFSGELLTAVEEGATHFRTWLIQSLPSSNQILPIIPCGHARVKNKHRLQFLIKTEKLAPLLHLLPRWKEHVRLKKGVYASIDIDPLSTFF